MQLYQAMCLTAAFLVWHPGIMHTSQPGGFVWANGKFSPDDCIPIMVILTSCGAVLWKLTTRFYKEQAIPLAQTSSIPYPIALERVMLDRLDRINTR